MPGQQRVSVYFIQAGVGGRIKIGYSPMPYRRIDYIRSLCGPNLIVLAVIEGSAGVEHNLHRFLSAHRAHHEWFEPAPEVLEVVRRAQTVPQDDGRRQDAFEREFDDDELSALCACDGPIGDAADAARRQNYGYYNGVLAILLRLFPEYEAE